MNLDLNQRRTIQIDSNRFTDNSVCWYQLGPKKSTLDETDLYLNLNFEQFENVDIFVSTASTLRLIQGHQTVTPGNQNFTHQLTNFYVAIQPRAPGASYKAKFTFSYYQKYWEYHLPKDKPE